MKEIEFPTVERARSTSLVNGGGFLIVIALGVAVYFTPLKTWLDEGQLIKDQLALFGIAAPAVFTLGAALLTAIGVPRLLLCSLGGMTFGFLWGLLWTQLGTLLGAYTAFLFVRWRGRDYTLQQFPRLHRFSQGLEKRGMVAVVVLRQVPMNGFYNNVFLGLTPVGHRDFIFGSLLGFLPLGVTACLIGAGLIQANVARGIQYVALAVACSVILGFLVNRLVNSRDASKTGLKTGPVLVDEQR